MISMDEIYRKHSRMIYAFLLSKTNDGDIAEELTQETFYRAVNLAMPACSWRWWTTVGKSDGPAAWMEKFWKNP